MLPIVASAIDRIYRRQDYAIFRSISMESIRTPNEFAETLRAYSANIIQYFADQPWPSAKWLVQYEPVQRGEFHARFSSSVAMSKLSPCYYVEHQFDVDNVDPDRSDPVLGGTSLIGYSRTQDLFQRQVELVLGGAGRTPLDYVDLIEVIPWLEFPRNVTLFGRQVTVQMALFDDFMGLLTHKDAQRVGHNGDRN